MLRPEHLGWLADESLCRRIRREIVFTIQVWDDLTVVSKSGVSGSQAAGPEMFRARKEDGSRATKPLRELP